MVAAESSGPIMADVHGNLMGSPLDLTYATDRNETNDLRRRGHGRVLPPDAETPEGSVIMMFGDAPHAAPPQAAPPRAAHAATRPPRRAAPGPPAYAPAASSSADPAARRPLAVRRSPAVVDSRPSAETVDGRDRHKLQRRQAARRASEHRERMRKLGQPVPLDQLPDVPLHCAIKGSIPHFPLAPGSPRHSLQTPGRVLAPSSPEWEAPLSPPETVSPTAPPTTPPTTPPTASPAASPAASATPAGVSGKAAGGISNVVETSAAPPRPKPTGAAPSPAARMATPPTAHEATPPAARGVTPPSARTAARSMGSSRSTGSSRAVMSPGSGGGSYRTRRSSGNSPNLARRRARTPPSSNRLGNSYPLAARVLAAAE